MLRAALTGAALGLVSLWSLPGLDGPVRRGGFAGILALAAGAVALAFAGENAALTNLVAREILSQTPQNWPVFVFDDAIRGWLKVCGQAPRDAIDVVQTCRARGIAAPIPVEQFELVRQKAGSALAVARGLPAVFGVIWTLLVPLLALVALAQVILCMITAFSETMLFRVLSPRALRSARLAGMRLLILVLLLATWKLPGVTSWPEARIGLWLALGSIHVAGVASIADSLIRFMRYRRGKQSAEASNSAIAEAA